VSALWTIEAMATAMGAERQGALPQSISGISIDTRTIAPGEAFFAIQGDNRDGHEFVAAALAAKAGLAVVAADRRGQFPTMRRSLSCPTCSPRCAISPPPRGCAPTPR
jgi:UDP-N-acetylmuramoyl-tripeptide--D-alanyl-D-alanine ligase